jgi:hypothetical protein
VSARRVRCSETIASLLLLKQKLGREFQFFFDIDIATTGLSRARWRHRKAIGSDRQITVAVLRNAELCPSARQLFKWEIATEQTS